MASGNDCHGPAASSDDPDSYGRPWLQTATNLLSHEEKLQNPSHRVNRGRKAFPRYKQGTLPSSPRGAFAAWSADRLRQHEPTYGAKMLDWAVHDATVQHFSRQTQCMEQPGVAVAQQHPSEQPALAKSWQPPEDYSARSFNGAGCYDLATVQHLLHQAPNVKQPGPIEPLPPLRREAATTRQHQALFAASSGYHITSEQVREAAYSDWLGQKEAQQKGTVKPAYGKQSSRAGPIQIQRSLPRTEASSQAQSMLTPEGLLQDSNHVRQTAYGNWMATKRTEQETKRRAEAAIASKQAASHDRAEKKRLDDAQVSYNAWRAQKDDQQALENKKIAQDKVDLLKRQEGQEREKNESAASAFLAWKGKKDELSKASRTQRRRQEVSQEQHSAARSGKRCDSVFDQW